MGMLHRIGSIACGVASLVSNVGLADHGNARLEQAAYDLAMAADDLSNLVTGEILFTPREPGQLADATARFYYAVQAGARMDRVFRDYQRIERLIPAAKQSIFFALRGRYSDDIAAGVYAVDRAARKVERLIFPGGGSHGDFDDDDDGGVIIIPVPGDGPHFF